MTNKSPTTLKQKTPEINWDFKSVIKELNGLADPTFQKGVSKFGIDTSNAIGVNIPQLRNLAKKIKTNQPLSDKLWQSKIHEAKLLAIFIADRKTFDYDKCFTWANSLYSWDLTDGFCGIILYDSKIRKKLIIDFSNNDAEYIRRSAFSLIAYVAAKDKNSIDDELIGYFPIILAHCNDTRNFVIKAINWSIRSIGKRNPSLNKKAIELCNKIISDSNIKSKWVASSALIELNYHKKTNKFKFDN